ncbi:hypothetical protein HMPREF3156_02709 [Neisseria sp. HMSC06F02]|nr:hypothetical protein HMPREF3156_02709 [Neisseria sp. HMSC06F02]
MKHINIIIQPSLKKQKAVCNQDLFFQTTLTYLYPFILAPPLPFAYTFYI